MVDPSAIALLFCFPKFQTLWTWSMLPERSLAVSNGLESRSWGGPRISKGVLLKVQNIEPKLKGRGNPHISRRATVSEGNLILS